MLRLDSEFWRQVNELHLGNTAQSSMNASSSPSKALGSPTASSSTSTSSAPSSMSPSKLAQNSLSRNAVVPSSPTFKMEIKFHLLVKFRVISDAEIKQLQAVINDISKKQIPGKIIKLSVYLIGINNRYDAFIEKNSQYVETNFRETPTWKKTKLKFLSLHPEKKKETDYFKIIDVLALMQPSDLMASSSMAHIALPHHYEEDNDLDTSEDINNDDLIDDLGDAADASHDTRATVNIFLKLSDNYCSDAFTAAQDVAAKLHLQASSLLPMTYSFENHQQVQEIEPINNRGVARNFTASLSAVDESDDSSASQNEVAASSSAPAYLEPDPALTTLAGAIQTKMNQASTQLADLDVDLSREQLTTAAKAQIIQALEQFMGPSSALTSPFTSPSRRGSIDVATLPHAHELSSASTSTSASSGTTNNNVSGDTSNSNSNQNSNDEASYADTRSNYSGGTASSTVSPNPSPATSAKTSPSRTALAGARMKDLKNSATAPMRVRALFTDSVTPQEQTSSEQTPQEQTSSEQTPQQQTSQLQTSQPADEVDWYAPRQPMPPWRQQAGSQASSTYAALARSLGIATSPPPSPSPAPSPAPAEKRRPREEGESAPIEGQRASAKQSRSASAMNETQPSDASTRSPLP